MSAKESAAETRGRTPSGRTVHRHLLGDHPAPNSEPLTLACAGIHGNEPAGIHAVRRLSAALGNGDGSRARGGFLGIAGNPGALAQQKRWVDYDLNRAWVPPKVARVRSGHGVSGCEARAQRTLLGIFQTAELRAGQRLRVLDLHTTSAPSPAFGIVTRRHLPFAATLGLPLLTGLENWISGTVMQYFAERGLPCVVVEAGQHEDPRAVEVHETTLRRALGLEAPAPPPCILEIFFARELAPDAHFKLRPGVRGFQHVAAGDLLGWENDREVRAPKSAVVIMPLAARRGEHAFFLARPARARRRRVA